MTINGCRKGKVCEREAAALLTRLGYPSCRNGRNGYSDADLQTPFARLHIEVKANRQIGLGTKALLEACAQAESDAGDRRWAVLWKEARKGWRLTTIHPETDASITVAGDDDMRVVLGWLEQSR